MVKFKGLRTAEVTVTVEVELDEVEFTAVGDVIHDSDAKVAAIEKVKAALADSVVFIGARADLDVVMDAKEEDAYEAACLEKYAEEDARRTKCDEIGKELGCSASVWSMGHGDSYHNRIINDDVFLEDIKEDIPLIYSSYEGTVTVFVAASDRGITYRNLWIAADAAIKQSGNNHHIFVENAKLTTEDDGANYLTLYTGS